MLKKYGLMNSFHVECWWHHQLKIPEVSRLPGFFGWCHQDSNRGHTDFQSDALPTELWHHLLPFSRGFFSFAGAKVGIFVKLAKFFAKKIVIKQILCTFALANEKITGSSAVGSALRSGRRGRAFESPLPDIKLKICKDAWKQFRAFFLLRYVVL